MKGELYAKFLSSSLVADATPVRQIPIERGRILFCQRGSASDLLAVVTKKAQTIYGWQYIVPADSRANACHPFILVLGVEQSTFVKNGQPLASLNSSGGRTKPTRDAKCPDCQIAGMLIDRKNMAREK